MIQECDLSDVSAVVRGFALYRDIKARINTLSWHRQRFKEIGIVYNDTLCEEDLENLRGMVRRLDINPLTQPPPEIGRNFREYGTAAEHVKEIFGTPLSKNYRHESGVVKKMLADAKAKAAEGRAFEMGLRLELEIYEKLRAGWFVVMNTLTVNRANHDKVFRRKNSRWSRYVEAITRDVARAVCGSRKAFERSALTTGDLHTYCAVVEKGDQGRLHIHAVHCLRKLPEGCVDPAKRQIYSTHREIHYFRGYWTGGFSTPVACRFYARDAYARVGWRWPLEADTDGVLSPLVPKPPAAVARYITDYMVEAYQQKEKIGWRTKTSQNLGKKALMMAISAMETETLRNLMVTIRDTSSLPKVNGRKIPAMMLRRMSIQQLLLRQRECVSSKNMNMILKALRPQMPLIERCRWMAMGKKEELLAAQKTMSMSTMRSSNLAISDACECIEMVFEELEINKRFIPGAGRNAY